MTVTLEDHLRSIPAAVRPAVEAAINTVRSLVPSAEVVVYQSQRPNTPSAMWKLVRYRTGNENVVGIGAFTEHATLFFHRGTKLHDPERLLRGTGRHMRSMTLRSPADARSVAISALIRDAFTQAGGASQR